MKWDIARIHFYSCSLRNFVGRTGENSGSEKDTRRRKFISIDPEPAGMTVIVAFVWWLIACGEDFVGVEMIVR